MTLKAKLLLSTLIEVVLVVVMSLMLIGATRQMNRLLATENRASEILDVVAQTRFVTFEYLLHHNVRSFEQWQAKNAGLAVLLEPGPRLIPEEKVLLESIKTHSSEAEAIFYRLVTSVSDTGKDQAELQDRLATQLLVKQQSQISDALKLTSTAREQTSQMRENADRLMALVILSMLLITCVNFLFITRTVTKVLAVLQNGAQKVAGGKYDYRLTLPDNSSEFSQLAAAFNAMAASMEQIDKVKSEFILLASHQLRTPLTAIKWYSQTLISSPISMTQARRRRYVTQIFSSNERMIDLVNKLLDASRIGMGNLKAKPEKVHLGETLDQVLRDMSVAIRDQNITLNRHVDANLPTLNMDPTWAYIILQNLISNAVRYSEQGKAIDVKVQKKPGGKLLFTVKDRGCGIPAHQQGKIFTKMFRADNAQKTIGEGTGVGLYIVKAMVEKVRGRIWFESQENKGTTFYVSLPITATPKPPVKKQPEPKA